MHGTSTMPWSPLEHHMRIEPFYLGSVTKTNRRYVIGKGWWNRVELEAALQSNAHDGAPWRSAWR